MGMACGAAAFRFRTSVLCLSKEASSYEAVFIMMMHNYQSFNPWDLWGKKKLSAQNIGPKIKSRHRYAVLSVNPRGVNQAQPKHRFNSAHQTHWQTVLRNRFPGHKV